MYKYTSVTEHRPRGTNVMKDLVRKKAVTCLGILRLRELGHDSRGSLWRKKRMMGRTEEPTKEPVFQNPAGQKEWQTGENGQEKAAAKLAFVIRVPPRTVSHGCTYP